MTLSGLPEVYVEETIIRKGSDIATVVAELNEIKKQIDLESGAANSLTYSRHDVVSLNDQHKEVEETDELLPDGDGIRREIEERSDDLLDSTEQDKHKREVPSELQCRVVYPEGTLSNNQMKQKLANCLLPPKSLNELSIVRCARIPRADYEDKAVEWVLNIKLEPRIPTGDYDRWQQVTRDRVVAFCEKSGFGLHEQPHLHIDLPRKFNERVMMQRGVQVNSIGVGQCPNAGLMLIRGDYFTRCNTWNLFNEQGVMLVPVVNGQSMVSKVIKGANYEIGTKTCLSYADFEHDKRVLKIYFATGITGESDGLEFAGFRLIINYNNVVQAVADMRNEGAQDKDFCVYFRLKYPPQLWEAVPRSTPLGGSQKRFVSIDNPHLHDWIRVVEWPSWLQSAGCSRKTLSQSQWLMIAVPAAQTGQFNSDHDVRKTMLTALARLASKSNVHVSFAAIKVIRYNLPTVPNIETLGSFRADYALKALISRGCVVTDQLFGLSSSDAKEEPVFLKKVRYAMKECSLACEDALESLLSAVDERRHIELLRAFYHLYSLRVLMYRSVEHDNDLAVNKLCSTAPKNCVMVRKVMITPTRTIFMAPEVMMANRVVRQFGSEHALRVVLRDESGGRLHAHDFLNGLPFADQQPELIVEMVHSTLTHGLRIAGRHYEFLAWSNSQMRDHGCYMYSSLYDENGEILYSVEDIRHWMGDFSSCKSVPKLMSRMGQCFTQAQPTVELGPNDWIVEDDIEGGSGRPGSNEPYCFSDGCGRLSAKLATRLAEILELVIVPSCFQVRFKGMKGIVVIDPVLDFTEGAPKVVFRKSQEKFFCAEESSILEIVKYSMPSPMCLNRPLITILDWVAEAQGRAVFERVYRKVHYYVERELSQLGGMLVDEKLAANELTQRVNLPIDFCRIRNCGFSLTDEPFIREMLVAVYRYNIVNHLTKAKIFLPPSMGRSLYGVVDETGLLQYGQVFIQYSPSIRQSSAHPILFTGRVLITKNPCHSPGDIRMFEAVYQPSLRHLVDVLVFPQHGPRPHPDQMAGSDLDGDEYSVIFDHELFILKNEQSMHYPQSKPDSFDEPPTTDDMVAFFLKFMRFDLTGRISSAHLVIADRLGLFSDTAMSLAAKCSIAVDFPKSGVEAPPLEPQEKSEMNPDYMPSHMKPCYRSSRLNGQIFRKTKKIDEILQMTAHEDSVFADNIDPVLCPMDWSPLEGFEAEIQNIRMFRDEYAARIQQLIDEYGINNEASIVSGHITNLKRLAAMERDDYSFYHTDKIVELRYAKIFAWARHEFFKEFGGEESLTESDRHGNQIVRTNNVIELKARRWYWCTYVDGRNGSRRPCLSLPWTIWDVLANARRNSVLHSVGRSPLDVAKLSDMPIAECLTREIYAESERSQEEFSEFKRLIFEKRGFAWRYTVAYGHTVVHILFVLRRWLAQEEMMSRWCVREEQVWRLFIQWARGQQHGRTDGTADGPEYQIHFAFPVSPNEIPSPLSVLVPDPGVLLLLFLRYLGSQRFALAAHMDLSLDDGETGAPVLLRNNHWMTLNQHAFRTYHRIAVSGRFAALGIGPAGIEAPIGESRVVNLPSIGEFYSDPVVVMPELLDPSSSSVTLSSSLIRKTVYDWTGATMVIRWMANRKQGVYLVTLVGTAEARLRASRLLMMPAERLRIAIAERRIPTEIYDNDL